MATTPQQVQHPTQSMPKIRPYRAEGQCKLTGTHGCFVKAHILPVALTRPSRSGVPLFQTGDGLRPVKRMTSWYDPGLVTAEGEAVLAEHDSWAIGFLRKNKLVWSGLPAAGLSEAGLVHMGNNWSLRIVDSDDWPRLRLFLLSLLWRAAASELSEFSEITLDEVRLQRLAKIVGRVEPDDFEFFPMSLVQLTSKGPQHNHTPIVGTKSLGSKGPILDYRVSFFRFFVEGLIIHFEKDLRDSADLGPAAVGPNRRVSILCRPYDGSFQEETLGQTLLDAWDRWPHIRPQVLGAMMRPEA